MPQSVKYLPCKHRTCIWPPVLTYKLEAKARARVVKTGHLGFASILAPSRWIGRLRTQGMTLFQNTRRELQRKKPDIYLQPLHSWHTCTCKDLWVHAQAHLPEVLMSSDRSPFTGLTGNRPELEVWMERKPVQMFQGELSLTSNGNSWEDTENKKKN